MLKGRPLIYMILFFVSEALMVGASPFLFRSWSYEQAQVAILGLFAISAFLCLLLMKSLMAMIRRDASAQALETLKDMELEQLAAMVQTGHTDPYPETPVSHPGPGGGLSGSVCQPL